jgi:glycosyltransferase involved in cell wall biosynthesis
MQNNPAKRKINILHVTFDMRIGGTEMVIKNLINGADKTCFNLFLFCIEEPIGPWGMELQQQGINITSQSRHVGFDFSMISSIYTCIKRHNIDVVHCHQYTPWVYGALASLLTKARVIFTEHGRFYPDSTTWKRRLVNPILMLLTSKVTAISEATKKALVKYEYIPKNKIDVIFNGIKKLAVDSTSSVKVRNRYKINQDAVLLGTVARLDSIKNHKMMLNAFSSLSSTAVPLHLVIVGDGDERDNLEKQITALGIQNKVTMTGYKSNPADYLNAIDIFLLPSFSEGTSMTLLEAMSLGKPCIATDVGGNSEVIQDGVTGLLIPNDDERSLVQAINKVIRSETLHNDLQKAALQRFEDKFSNNIMNENFKQAYQSVME